jgi:hypothetical protein
MNQQKLTLEETLELLDRITKDLNQYNHNDDYIDPKELRKRFVHLWEWESMSEYRRNQK